MAGVREQAALLALLERVSQRWHLVAALVERTGSALALIRDGAQAVDADEAEFAAELVASVPRLTWTAMPPRSLSGRRVISDS
jgi:hypothetical protein